jgi:hypothetical protein
MYEQVGSAWCELYRCEARFFIKDYWYGKRTLVVEYGEGYCGPWLPRAANGRPVFEAVIPGHWSHDELVALLLMPPIVFDGSGLQSYPTWETGARYFGSEYLAWPNKTPKLVAA